MKILDQGHLHHKLEVPRETGVSRPGIKAIQKAIEKSHSNSLLIAIQNIYEPPAQERKTADYKL